jgi:hypothetical protein
MGLLDNTYIGSIYDEWKNRNNIEDVYRNAVPRQSMEKKDTKSSSPLDPRNLGFTGNVVGRQTGVTGDTRGQAMMDPKNTQQLAKPPVMQQPSDPITTGGMGTQLATDTNFLTKLSNLAGIDFGKAAEQWKDKGGFEGLMANPAFTLGLAFMQAGAEGKTLGQGSLDNVLKAGAISQQYKKILESKKQAPIQATAADVAEVKELLEQFRIKEPNVFERGLGFLRGRNEQANFDRAAEAIAIEFQKEVAAAQKANKSGKPLVIDSAFKEKIIKKIIDSGKIKRKKGMFGPFTAGTVSKEPEFRMDGGPVESGKPYVVGEEGPEIIIPKSDGNVLTNDDSQIYAMLLAANPQLQQVSRQRAEKILRARFPEYFEG